MKYFQEVKWLFFLMFFCLPFFLQAQVGINTDNNDPDPSAMLDVSSNSKGMLTPRMTQAEREAIGSPATGLLVYQTDEEEGFYYFDGVRWMNFGPQSILGDLPIGDSCIEQISTLNLGLYPEVSRISGHYMYVFDDDNELKIIDVSDPNNPLIVGNLGIGSGHSAVTISDNIAYIIQSFPSDKLKAFDVSDPNNPYFVSDLPIGGSPRTVEVVGNYAYVGNWLNQPLKVFDVSDPANLSQVGSVSIGDRTRALLKSGDYLYVIQTDALKVIDVSDPMNPNQIASRSLYLGYQIAISGQYAYVSEYDDLSIFDISDPSNPTKVGSAPISNSGRGVAVSGDYAFIGTQYSSTLNIINISDPSMPEVVGSQNGVGDAHAISVLGNYAYVLNRGAEKLLVFQLGCQSNLAYNGLSGQLVAAEIEAQLDNLGDHTATQTLDMDGNDLSNGGTITANAFVGDGSGLTNVDDDLGSHIATQNMQLNGNWLSNDGGNEGLFVAADGDVGIGTNAPAEKLEVEGNLRMDTDNAKLIFTSGSSSLSLRNTSEIRTNVNPPNSAGTIDPGDNNMTFRVATNDNGGSAEVMRLQGDGHVGIGTTTPQSFLHLEYPTQGENSGIRLSSGGINSLIYQDNGDLILRKLGRPDQLVLDASGNIGMGINNPSHPLEMASGARATSSGIWAAASDSTRKYAIRDLEYGLKEILRLRPAAYSYKSDSSASIGFIAQEMEQVIPEVVSGEEGNMGVAYGLLTSVLVNAMQEQQHIMERQQQMIEQLLREKAAQQTMNQSLESRLQALEALLSQPK